jgi:digeranylgeranylglycerophospholipid reductase
VCAVERDHRGVLRGVELRTPSGPVAVACDALLAADGVAAGVGRLAGIPTRLAVGELLSAAQVRLFGAEVEVGTLEFWIGDAFAPGGYAWVFPRGTGEANVGVAIVADRPSAAGETATHWLRVFRKQRFKGIGKADDYIVGGIPTLVRAAATAGQGVVLAGDAARVPDPLSAAGIAEGMHSGQIAAETLAEALSAGDLSAARLERAAQRYAAEHPVRGITARIRRIYDRLDDGQKGQLVRACRDAFDDRRIDRMDPLTVFVRLLRGSPGLVGYLRYLLPAP